MTGFRVALVQMEIALGDPEANFSRAERWIAQAASQGAQLVLLPELWATGYALPQAEALADPLGEGVFATMSRWAETYGVVLGGSHLEETFKGVHNTFALYGSDGFLWAAYRKIHLFAPLGERLYLLAGDQIEVVQLPWCAAGMAVCYDLRFPEMFRLQAVDGARVFLLVAEWPQQRMDHWHMLLRARAVENQAFVLAVNRVGKDHKYTYVGGSSVIGPDGRLKRRLGADPGLLIEDIDLAEVDQARAKFSPVRERRPEVYRQFEERIKPRDF